MSIPIFRGLSHLFSTPSSGHVTLHTVSRAGLFLACICAFLMGSPAISVWAGPTADDILKALPITDDERQKVLNGEIVRWTTYESDDRELAVGIIMLKKGSPDKVVELFRGAEGYKLISAITGHGSISGKGSEADFAGLTLTPNGEKEAGRYLEAEPGDDHNLSTQEIAAFQALKEKAGDGAGKQAAVEAQIRKNLLARLQAYQSKGLDGTSPYERGDEKRVSSEEIRAAVHSNKVLASMYPKFNEVLLNYPKADMSGVEEKFYWLNIEVFGRPLLVLSHRLLFKAGDAYLASDRHFYASHEYNALQMVGGVWPKGESSLLAYLYRVSTDQVGGFGSSVKHPASRALIGPYVEDLAKEMRAR